MSDETAHDCGDTRGPYVCTRPAGHAGFHASMVTVATWAADAGLLHPSAPEDDDG